MGPGKLNCSMNISSWSFRNQRSLLVCCNWLGVQLVGPLTGGFGQLCSLTVSLHVLACACAITLPHSKRKTGGKKLKHHKTIKMAGIYTHISIITLSSSGVNSPIKRHRLGYRLDKKQDKSVYLLPPKKHTSSQKTDTHLGLKDRKKVFQTKRPRGQVDVTVLISDKVELKPKQMRKDKDLLIEPSIKRTLQFSSYEKVLQKLQPI